MKDWQGQIERDKTFATQQLLDHGEVRPMLILHTPHDGIKVMLLSFPDDRTKQLMHAAVRMMAIAYAADGAVMITEAWMAIGMKEDEKHPDMPSVMPRDREDKKEVVLIASAYRDEAGEQHQRVATLEILRDAAGKPTGVADISMHHGEMRSRWLDVLPPPGVPPALREAARTAIEELGVLSQIGLPVGGRA